MKLATYEPTPGSSAVGVLNSDETHLVPLVTIGGQPGFETMIELIEAGPEGLDRVRSAQQHADVLVPLADVRLLAPLPRPVQIRDVVCFFDHMLNAGRVAARMQGRDPDQIELPEVYRTAPRYYKANRMCVIGPDHDIEWPNDCAYLDYELELGIIIGTKGKNLAPDEAAGHVFGYTVFNDVSARDLQFPEMAGQLGPAKGKDFDTGNVLGPYIATADSVIAGDMTMIARLNGEEISRGSTSQMDHTISEAVAYISKNETIYPGEVVGSGTVPLGCLLEHERSLQPGDIVELEIEGIGVLRNRVVKPASV